MLDGRVYAIDAKAFFTRPGRRVIDSIELLVHLFHPEHFAWMGAADEFARVELRALALAIDRGTGS